MLHLLHHRFVASRGAWPVGLAAPLPLVGLLGALLFPAACALVGRPLPRAPVTREDALVRASHSGSEASRRSARRRLERLRFAAARRLGTVLGWRRFLVHHPKGIFADQAREELARALFRVARRADTPAAYRVFLRSHGGHPLGPKVWRLLNAKLVGELLHGRDRRAIVAFLKRFARSPHAPRLRKRLEEIDLASLGPTATMRDLETFLLRYPASPHGAAIRRRVAARLAERVARFGDRRDLASLERRFPQVASAARVQVQRRALRRAVLSLDRSALARLASAASGASRTAIRQLAAWIGRRSVQSSRLRAAIRGALPWRPSARERALVAASGGADPRVAAFALRGLAYHPTLVALDTILRAVASTDSAISSIAVDALAAWAIRSPRAPARRLLKDRAARLRPRKDAASRVVEAALLRTLGDWPGLLKLLSSRSWHRPWALVPRYLWLETLPTRQAAGESRAGRLVLRAFRDEHRKLSQMLPTQVLQSSRRRAEAAVFELDRLAQLASRLVARHGATGGKWVRELRTLASRCRRQRDSADRQLGGFPGYSSVLMDRLDRERRRHAAGRSGARTRLQGLLRRLRPPALLLATLCDPRGGHAKSLLLICRGRRR